MASGHVPLSSETVVGWRIWNLSEDASGPLLWPSGSGADPWPRRRPVEARCTVPRLLTTGMRPHKAPRLDCRCGVYASGSLDVFGHDRPAWPPPPVVGRASLWGTVIDHERGWRARFAYPERLRLVCAMCAWFEPGPGTPTVVHEFCGRLYTLCEIHRGGIQVPDGRRTRPTGMNARELQARVLDAYAVDLLPAGSLEPLFRRPPTREPAAYIPSIRSVPVEEEEGDCRAATTKPAATRRRSPCRARAIRSIRRIE
jgi:hypothetical protein